MRANKQIWRLAEWLHANVTWSNLSVPWIFQPEEFRNKMYDKAKQLQYMFLFNTFTGPDNHE